MTVLELSFIVIVVCLYVLRPNRSTIYVYDNQCRDQKFSNVEGVVQIQKTFFFKNCHDSRRFLIGNSVYLNIVISINRRESRPKIQLHWCIRSVLPSIFLYVPIQRQIHFNFVIVYWSDLISNYLPMLYKEVSYFYVLQSGFC